MEQKNNTLSIVLAIILTAIIVGGGMYWLQSTETTAQPPAVKVTDTKPATTPTIKPDVESEATTAIIKYGYKDGSVAFESFESDIKSKTGEFISSFNAPASPLDNDVIFVSTFGNSTGEWPELKITNKIYSYNIKTGKLIKLYEEHKDRESRTIGIEGSKLIVLHSPIDYSPGPCTSIWSDPSGFGYSYLDIKNPTQLKSYTIPAYQVKKGKDESLKCTKDIGF